MARTCRGRPLRCTTHAYIIALSVNDDNSVDDADSDRVCMLQMVCRGSWYLSILQQKLRVESAKFSCSLFQCATVSLEDFRTKVAELTGLHLKAFVIPFLRANLPIMQNQLLVQAKAAKLNTLEFLSNHGEFLVDPATMTCWYFDRILLLYSNCKETMRKRRSLDVPDRA